MSELTCLDCVHSVITVIIFKINYLLIFTTSLFLLRAFTFTIPSIHRQSRRLILCTVPPHILCRPNTIRYSLVLNVHDQRQRRRHTTSNRYIKVSSPTLRKLCLPCISARNHRHQPPPPPHPQTRQPSNKNKSSKNNQLQTTTVPTTESNVIESSHRLEVAPRTHDPIPTIPVVHSSEYLQENDANHSHEQQHQYFQTLLQSEKIERITADDDDDDDDDDDKLSSRAEIIPIKTDSESILPTVSSLTNEISRSNEDEAVGRFVFDVNFDRFGSINQFNHVISFLLFICSFSSSASSVMIKRHC